MLGPKKNESVNIEYISAAHADTCALGHGWLRCVHTCVRVSVCSVLHLLVCVHVCSCEQNTDGPKH